MTTGKKIAAIFIIVVTCTGVFFSIWGSAAPLHTRLAENPEHSGQEEADENCTNAMADLNQLYDEVRAQGLLQ